MSSPMLGGGRSNFTLTPVRHDGVTRDFYNLDSADLVGLHSGDFVGLNVANPQPGKHYQWIRNLSSDHLHARAMGGIPVTSDNPASPAHELALQSDQASDMPTPLDTGCVHQDVVLYEYPDERIRERRQRDAAKALSQVRYAERQFLDGATANELAAGQGRATRFARRAHNLQVQDDSGAAVEAWTPSQGILED